MFKGSWWRWCWQYTAGDKRRTARIICVEVKDQSKLFKTKPDNLVRNMIKERWEVGCYHQVTNYVRKTTEWAEGQHIPGVKRLANRTGGKYTERGFQEKHCIRTVLPPAEKSQKCQEPGNVRVAGAVSCLHTDWVAVTACCLPKTNFLAAINNCSME